LRPDARRPACLVVNATNAHLVGMATQTLPAGPQPFSRIIESRRTNSWRAAIPAATIVIVAVVAAAYFAAKASESSQLLSGTRTEMTQQRQAVAALQTRSAALEGDLNRLRTAGRTTVILQPSAPPAAKKGKAAEAVSGAWGAATLGEQPDGKTWIRLDAYGLAQPPQGKVYELWLQTSAAAPVMVAKLDPAQDGTAFGDGKDLPAIDQGTRLFLSVDDEEAKKPGSEVFQAELPKLKASVAAQPAQPAAAPDTGAAAKSGVAAPK
jgi:hypothetical protein